MAVLLLFSERKPGNKHESSDKDFCTEITFLQLPKVWPARTIRDPVFFMCPVVFAPSRLNVINVANLKLQPLKPLLPGCHVIWDLTLQCLGIAGPFATCLRPNIPGKPKWMCRFRMNLSHAGAEQVLQVFLNHVDFSLPFASPCVFTWQATKHPLDCSESRSSSGNV